jgi:predicted transposase YbfD/YdcC
VAFLVQILFDESLNGLILKYLSVAFRGGFLRIVKTIGAPVIPIDGKTLRSSYDREQQKSALHLVSAWASQHRLALGQVKVADKSNEITAIPALLELLSLAGSIITIDAMGTQTAIATQIYSAKADYILALKANHRTLHGQVKTWFDQALALKFEGISFSYNEQIEKDITVLKKDKFGASQFLNYHRCINNRIGWV